MICKFVDVNNLSTIDLGDEKCVGFVRIDADKYDIGGMSSWFMEIANRMPQVDWCLLPVGIDLEFVDKANAVSYLDVLKEKINEA